MARQIISVFLYIYFLVEGGGGGLDLMSLLSNFVPSLKDHLANAIGARYSSTTTHNEPLDCIYITINLLCFLKDVKDVEESNYGVLEVTKLRMLLCKTLFVTMLK